MFHDDPENDNMDLLPYVASIWDLETQFHSIHDHTVYPGRGASIGRLLALVIWIENMSHISKSLK